MIGLLSVLTLALVSQAARPLDDDKFESLTGRSEVLKGEVPDGKIRVAVMLVSNSLTADVNRAQLSPELFRKKNTHILFLERYDQRPATDKKQLPWLKRLSYKSVDSDHGAVMAARAAASAAKILALAAATLGAAARERP